MHFHFTPTRASWLNQVEIWFSILEGKSLQAASFNSVARLREHIDAFIEAYITKASESALTSFANAEPQTGMKPSAATNYFKQRGLLQ